MSELPPPEENLSFNLIMDGIYASIKLNKLKPDKGMTKAQSEEHLKRWFPEAEVEIEEF